MKRSMLLVLGLLITGTLFSQPNRTVKLKSPAITKDTLHQRVQHDLDFIQPTPHDTIADIGSYDGYYPLLYSVFSDSVVFYLSDVSTTGFSTFDSLRFLSQHIGKKNFTNVFFFSIGTDSGANLPAKKFNKVLVRDALHHFESPDQMLADLRKLLKPGGKLILFEPLLPETGENKKLCKGAMDRKTFMVLMKKHGFVPEREFKGKNDHYWFVFSHKA